MKHHLVHWLTCAAICIVVHVIFVALGIETVIERVFA